MKKIIKIDGMTCEHCVKRATTALNSIDGITDVKVNLKKKNATVKLYKEVDESLIKDAFKEVNLEFVSMKDKKGLFS